VLRGAPHEAGVGRTLHRCPGGCKRVARMGRGHGDRWKVGPGGGELGIKGVSQLVEHVRARLRASTGQNGRRGYMDPGSLRVDSEVLRGTSFTVDGGLSWQEERDFGPAFNRIRFLKSGYGVAVGTHVFRLIEIP